MNSINLTEVVILNNNSPYSSPIEVAITFECNKAVKEDIEFKLTYVGSPESPQFDQVLESIVLNSINVGVFKFVIPAKGPDHTRIPEKDVLGATCLLLTVHFRQRMFCKVGYVLRNEYDTKELMDAYNEAQTKSTPLPPLQIDKVIRVINAEKPICTVYTIPWDDSSPDAEWNVVKDGTEREEVVGNGEDVDEEDIDYSDEEEDLSNEEDESESISDNEMENDNDNENE